MESATVDRRHLHKAMQAAMSVANYRNSIPVLRTIRATANGALALEATDLDTSLRAEVPYEGEHTSFLIPDPRKVSAAINAAGGATASFGVIDSKTLSVSAADFTAHLNTLPVDDFPGFEGVAEEDFAAVLTAADFAQIARVFPAISTEDIRYYLNGVCIEKVGDWTWRFTATDGHRLMMVDVPLPGATGELPHRVIAPRAWLNLVARHFAKTDKPLRLTYGPKVRRNEAGVELPLGSGSHRMALQGWTGEAKLTLATKLVDGHYPDYTRVVPGDAVFSARLDRSQLIRAITTIASLGNERVRAVRLTFADGKVTLSLTSADLGEGAVTIACAHNLDAGTVVGFNGHYLIGCANSLRGEELTMSWATADQGFGGPCAIVDPADTAFKAVLMPMRV